MLKPQRLVNRGIVVGLMLTIVGTVGVIADGLVYLIQKGILGKHLGGLLPWSAAALGVFVLTVVLYWQKWIPFYYFGLLMTAILVFAAISFSLIVGSLSGGNPPPPCNPSSSDCPAP
jgi:hypothetical protein